MESTREARETLATLVFLSSLLLCFPSPSVFILEDRERAAVLYFLKIMDKFQCNTDIEETKICPTYSQRRRMFSNIVQRVLLREYNCQHPSISYSGEMTRKLQDFAKDLHTKNQQQIRISMARRVSRGKYCQNHSQIDGLVGYEYYQMKA